MFSSGYVNLYRSGKLHERIEKARKLLQECQICPRRCKVNRLENRLGICKVGKRPKVSGYNPHFGEESPLVGVHGSGTIFITSCNLGCVFCQNHDISHCGEGYEISIERLAHMMIELQDMGCHNINFVTPTHVVPQILEALPMAIRDGLNIPLVYNTGGYHCKTCLSCFRPEKGHQRQFWTSEYQRCAFCTQGTYPLSMASYGYPSTNKRDPKQIV